jgi:hypothetical protein
VPVLCPVVLQCQIDETTLFNADGSPEAYISFSQERPTIYLWSGEPVAYLSSSFGGDNIYGFNGKHLGWFIDGTVRSRDGSAVCGVHRIVRAISTPKLEPLKPVKQVAPPKSSKEPAPERPLFKRQWSATQCGLFFSEAAPRESD